MLIAVLVASIFGVTIPVSTAQTPEYLKGEGVLDSDNYILYPYDESKSLSFGVSAYGEPIYAEPIIDPATGKLKADYSDYIDQCVGLEYDGVDVFCNPVIPVKMWCNGWVINITWIEDAEYKNLWAYALFSDTLNAEDSVAGPWHRASSAYSTASDELGGRRWGGNVPGYVESKDPVVLYDGPRKKIILLETNIYEDPSKEINLVNLYFTIIFDKVKKYVVWIKDIKRPWHPPKPKYETMQVEFSERGQWDLYPPEPYGFFLANQSTKYYKHPWYGPRSDPYTGPYAAGFDVAQVKTDDYAAFMAFWPNLTVRYIDAFERSMTPDRIRLSSVSTWVDVFVEGPDFVAGESDFTTTQTPVPYPRGDIDDDNVVDWDDCPMVFVNDLVYYKDEHFTWDSNTNTVHFKPGYEPGEGDVVKLVYKTRWYERMDMAHEPAIPFIIGEWAFDLLNPADHDPQWAHFRCVTVYGIVDNHDATDADQDSRDNIDREIWFQLDEVFNPWDLQDAVEKFTERQVYKEELTETLPDGEEIELPHPKEEHRSIWDWDALDLEWDQYCVFAEKVLVALPGEDFKLVPPDGYGDDDPNDHDFAYDFNPEAGTITFTQDLPAGTKIKILYSTVRDVEKVDEFDPDDAVETKKHYFHYPNVKDVKFVMAYDSRYGWEEIEPTPTIQWEDWGPYKKIPYIEVPTSEYYTKYKVVYDCELGRYEWNVVGRDSAAVDSAGASMVTEAFEEWKNIQVVDAALDMQDTEFGEYIPWVMAKMNQGYPNPDWMAGDRPDYYDLDGRLYLKDDWCCKVPPLTTCSSTKAGVLPISSANLISVGGPYPNVLTQYFNDFTDALILSPDFGEQMNIPPIWTFYGYGCWNHRAVLETQRTSGYAIVATYKDLNGTIGFIVEGWDGQDTYYACWALRHGLIEYLNFIQPGVTALVLHICYASHPPTISVVECLGTITECSGFDHVEGGVSTVDSIITTIASEKCISDKLIDIDWPKLHPDP